MQNLYFTEILDKNRQQCLSIFKNLPKDFYLSGGTALALQIGHRFSEDFDFFTMYDFDTQKLYEILVKIFGDIGLTKIYEEKNTLRLITNTGIKLDFLTYTYPLIKPLIKTKYFDIADKLDIAATKIISTSQRCTKKDFVDIYFLLHEYSLKDIFEICRKKYTNFNESLYLKSLIYFDECTDEMPKMLKKLDFTNVKDLIFIKVKDWFRNNHKK